jgi:formamidopyrimidine-DNA glycosylase
VPLPFLEPFLLPFYFLLFTYRPEVPMPELPEVETVVRQLRSAGLVGCRVRAIAVHTPRCLRCQSVPIESLRGRTVRDITRRGKFIRLDFSGRVTVLVHLRMTGVLSVDPAAPPGKHDHIDLSLSGRRLLRFSDVRKFGGWWLLRQTEADTAPPLSALGPEPLEISRPAFRALLSSRRQAVKALLLDQRRLAGMGNIYCDESLFAAKIHPATLASRISPAKADALWRHMRRILRLAILHRGSSVSDFVDIDGRGGRFQHRHKVYGYGGAPCPCCKTNLVRTRVAGRGTVFCPKCQKK